MPFDGTTGRERYNPALPRPMLHFTTIRRLGGLSDVARALGISPRHTARWLSRGIPHGRLPAVAEYGRSIGVSVDIDALMAETPRKPHAGGRPRKVRTFVRLDLPPLPPDYALEPREGRGRWLYPIHLMDIGEDVFIVTPDLIEAAKRALRSRQARESQTGGLRRWRHRMETRHGIRGLRIWRIADAVRNIGADESDTLARHATAPIRHSARPAGVGDSRTSGRTVPPHPADRPGNACPPPFNYPAGVLASAEDFLRGA